MEQRRGFIPRDPSDIKAWYTDQSGHTIYAKRLRYCCPHLRSNCSLDRLGWVEAGARFDRRPFYIPTLQRAAAAAARRSVCRFGVHSRFRLCIDHMLLSTYRIDHLVSHNREKHNCRHAAADGVTRRGLLRVWV
jgi:hypothetical protein